MGTAVRRLLLTLLVVGLVFAGCSDDEPEAGDTAGETTTTADDGGAAGGSTEPAAEISIADFAFSPSTLEIDAGATVTVTNDDSATHTWTGEGWDSGNLSSGGTFEHTFDEAGSFPFRCKIHSSMKGTVEVS